MGICVPARGPALDSAPVFSFCGTTGETTVLSLLDGASSVGQDTLNPH